MGKFGQQIVQPALGTLDFGEITDETGEQPAAFGLGLADRQFDRKTAAIAPARRRDPADADDMGLSGLHVMLHIGIVTVTIRIGHQDPDVLAQHFRIVIAEHPVRGFAEQQDGAGFIDHDHRIGNGGQNGILQRLGTVQQRRVGVFMLFNEWAHSE